VDKMREKLLKLFWSWSEESEAIKTVMELSVERRKGRGKPKKK